MNTLCVFLCFAAYSGLCSCTWYFAFGNLLTCRPLLSLWWSDVAMLLCIFWRTEDLYLFLACATIIRVTHLLYFVKYKVTSPRDSFEQLFAWHRSCYQGVVLVEWVEMRILLSGGATTKNSQSQYSGGMTPCWLSKYSDYGIFCRLEKCVVMQWEYDINFR